MQRRRVIATMCVIAGRLVPSALGTAHPVHYLPGAPGAGDPYFHSTRDKARYTQTVTVPNGPKIEDSHLTMSAVIELNSASRPGFSSAVRMPVAVGRGPMWGPDVLPAVAQLDDHASVRQRVDPGIHPLRLADLVPQPGRVLAHLGLLASEAGCLAGI
jgi:hypothetical protein